MAKKRIKNKTLKAYLIALVAYAFIASLAAMLQPPLSGAVSLLSLQCICVLFAVSIYMPLRSDEESWPKRFIFHLKNFLFPAGFVFAGALSGIFSSFVTPVPVGDILLVAVFSLSFGLFIAGLATAFRAIATRALSQLFTLAAGLLMTATPYYVNSFILATSGNLRMHVVQWAININPLLVGASGIMEFDWLRAPQLYDQCLIGGYQYPFSYPSAVKVGIIFALGGIILTGLSALRKDRTDN